MKSETKSTKTPREKTQNCKAKKLIENEKNTDQKLKPGLDEKKKYSDKNTREKNHKVLITKTETREKKTAPQKLGEKSEADGVRKKLKRKNP